MASNLSSGDCRTPRRATLTARFVPGLLFLALWPLAGAATLDIGASTGGTRIEAFTVDANTEPALTVVLIGGLHGGQGTTNSVRTTATRYARQAQRPVKLIWIPLANPDQVQMQFPPGGAAYRENAESHALWRWLGTLAPDLVLIDSKEDFGLVEALRTESVAGMGRIPAEQWTGRLEPASGTWRKSDAHLELEARSARSPRQLAVQLAAHYGQDFDQPWYIGAIALMARLRLGEIDAVRRLAEPWVDGSKDSLARPNALVMAGHILFADLARRTGDPRYAALARKVADLGFDASGQMLDAMPYHDGFSDSVFMGTAILAQVGALTGEQRYFAMADRHLRFMEGLDLRPDGLYRHRPEADVAWGRGNGFAALGLALMLSELPAGSPGHAHALKSYQMLMQTLLPWQTADGLWRNVVNHPDAYREFSGTAMIGFALQRGLARGWISGPQYEAAVSRAWHAVNIRSSASGLLVDVCESTARFTTLEQYLQRTAILGEDSRGGAMAMLFATELMETRTDAQ